jgi:hypothetical protein
VIILIITTILENSLNLTTRLFLLLTLSGLLFAAGCGQRPSSVDTLSSLDKLVEFDNNGYAVIRGRISSDSSCSTTDGTLSAYIEIEVPADVQGIEAGIAVPFTLRFETEILSNLTTHTNVRDYLAANPESTTFDAFPILETVEVTFVKKDAAFEAVAIRQVDSADTSNQNIAAIDGIFSTDIFSKGRLEGSTGGSNWGDVVTWTISMPVTVHGVDADILLPINSTDKTQVITEDGTVPVDIYHPGGHVQVEFTRAGNTLEAVRFTEIP